MQNHMRAKIWDTNSISYAWIFPRLLAQLGAKGQYVMLGFFAPCLAPVRRKMFISHVWIFALLLLHRGYQAKTSYFTIRHSMIACAFFCLETSLHSKARNVTHKATPVLHSNIFRELFLLCIIVLGNKALETSWNYTFLGYTSSILGVLISVKRHAKYLMITQSTLGISQWLCEQLFGFLHGFRRISGAKRHMKKREDKNKEEKKEWQEERREERGEKRVEDG